MGVFQTNVFQNNVFQGPHTTLPHTTLYTLKRSLVAYLESISAVSSLVSSRVYPITVPQSVTLPAISYLQVSSDRVYHIRGDMNKARSLFQIDCWSSTYAGAHQLADAVRRTLDGFYGSMIGTEIHSITIDNELDLFEDEVGTVGAYRVMQDYTISHLGT